MSKTYSDMVVEDFVKFILAKPVVREIIDGVYSGQEVKLDLGYAREVALILSERYGIVYDNSVYDCDKGDRG